MKYIVSLVFLLQEIINGVNFAIAEPIGPKQQVARCRDTGNFKSDSLQSHRDSAFETLVRSIGSPEYTGYYSTQSGSGKIGDQVYATTLCPTNVKVSMCQECIKNTALFLKQNCPKQKEGVGYTSLVQLNCMVHYADEEIQGKRAADWGSASFWNPTNEIVKNVDKELNDLAAKLIEMAAKGDVFRKFASGSVIYEPDKRNLYGAMQCTPDLTKEECVRCLHNVVAAAHNITNKGKVSGRSLSPSCYVRYSHANFLPKNLSAIFTNT